MAKNTEDKKEKRDQYTVVLEDLRDQFRVFGEALSVVRDDTEEIKKIQGLHTEILSSHGQKLDSHTEMIGKLMTGATDIKNGLRQKVEVKDFRTMESRIRVLEKRH